MGTCISRPAEDALRQRAKHRGNGVADATNCRRQEETEHCKDAMFEYPSVMPNVSVIASPASTVAHGLDIDI